MARRRSATRERTRRLGHGRPTSRPTPVPPERQPMAGTTADGDRDPEPEALVVSALVEGLPAGVGSDLVVRFSGRRVEPTAGARETFAHDEATGLIPSGALPLVVTAWIYGLAHGSWDVEARLVATGASGRETRPIELPLAGWSWFRWRPQPRAAAPVQTRWAPLAPLGPIPGVLPFSWTVLALVAIFVAIWSGVLLASDAGFAPEVTILVALTSVLVGAAFAKIWFAIIAPEPFMAALIRGWAVDGFLVTAPLAAIAMLLLLGRPVGPYLDAMTPGIFFAVAIGRVGCQLAGCCSGRLTGSRLAIWGSDRRLGGRRLPAQLIESGVGLLLALASLVLLAGMLLPPGGVFIVGIASYLVARQALLRTRAHGRRFSWQRHRAADTRRS